MFGSNTANQADVVFDDGLDGNYAGLWHMNESVDSAGNLDKTRSPDTSGYFNSATVHGAPFLDANNGLFGKALQLDGQTAWLEVPHSDSLTPGSVVSLELWVRPDAPVDCDGNNNYRLLLSKGNISGPYAVILEDGEVVRIRVHAGGVERDALADHNLPIGEWSHIGATYDSSTGQLRLAGLHGVQLDGLWPGVTDQAWVSFGLYLLLFDAVDYAIHRGQHRTGLQRRGRRPERHKLGLSGRNQQHGA